jgi:hypothetical protein
MHDGKFNVVKSWTKMEPWMPLHSSLALRVYSALPTEANCERTFLSLACSTMTKLRHKIEPKTPAALVVVGARIRRNGDLDMGIGIAGSQSSPVPTCDLTS